MLKRTLRVILSKTFAFAVLIVLQIAFFCALIYWLANIGSVVYTIFTVVTVLVLVVVLEKDDVNPAYKLMWAMVIMLMPLFGALFYLMWGHRTVPRRKRRAMQAIDARIRAAVAQDEAVLQALDAQDTDLAQSARYLLNWSTSPVYPAQGCAYYPLGEDFFPPFLAALRGAKKYIFMQYYIVEEGTMLDTVLDILRQKAAEGVEVRLMWDGFGSLFTLPSGFAEKLDGWGIKHCAFSPLELTIHLNDYAMLNHRDHRKITVVDGAVGFTGGLNIADEYINLKERFGLWKDTALMLRGEAVYALTTTFLRSWDYAYGGTSEVERFRLDALAQRGLPAAGVADAPADRAFCLRRGYVQPYWDSPLDGESISENAYLNIIRHATRYVYISTPYLILDHEMITALTLAAKSGVDVRVLTPGIPDKPTVFLVTQSYYPVLLEGGVRIYEYTPGFNHAKMYVSDDKAAIVGSANMDYRSLYLHFENCVAFYGGPMVGEVRRDMEACFAAAHEVTLEETRRLPVRRRLVQIVAKFFAPLL